MKRFLTATALLTILLTQLSCRHEIPLYEKVEAYNSQAGAILSRFRMDCSDTAFSNGADSAVLAAKIDSAYRAAAQAMLELCRNTIAENPGEDTLAMIALTDAAGLMGTDELLEKMNQLDSAWMQRPETQKLLLAALNGPSREEMADTTAVDEPEAEGETEHEPDYKPKFRKVH